MVYNFSDAYCDITAFLHNTSDLELPEYITV